MCFRFLAARPKGQGPDSLLCLCLITKMPCWLLYMMRHPIHPLFPVSRAREPSLPRSQKMDVEPTHPHPTLLLPPSRAESADRYQSCGRAYGRSKRRRWQLFTARHVPVPVGTTRSGVGELLLRTFGGLKVLSNLPGFTSIGWVNLFDFGLLAQFAQLHCFFVGGFPKGSPHPYPSR